eukprot:4966721-Alexandrium_andersonii.AAC.1
MIFVDALGPIHPPDGEHRYLFHAECPFTRFAWIEASPTDDDEEWAEVLGQGRLLRRGWLPGGAPERPRGGLRQPL